jgi:hypothetical protein
MKVKHMRALLNNVDDELELYIETSLYLNNNCRFSSTTGAKVFVWKHPLTGYQMGDIMIIEHASPTKDPTGNIIPNYPNELGEYK